MKITILLDHDLEGFSVFLQPGLKETGWDQVFTIEFKRLRDFGLPENCSDHEIWRFAQRQSILLVTGNRNYEGETSLQATIVKENLDECVLCELCVQAAPPGGVRVVKLYDGTVLER